MSSAPTPNARMWLVARGSKDPTRARSRYPTTAFEESPKNVNGCRGEPLAGRFRKGTLKGASHRAGDKVRDGVCRKNGGKEVRHKPKPIHNAALLLFNDLLSTIFPVAGLLPASTREKPGAPWLRRHRRSRRRPLEWLSATWAAKQKRDMSPGPGPQVSHHQCESADCFHPVPRKGQYIRVRRFRTPRARLQLRPGGPSPTRCALNLDRKPGTCGRKRSR